MSSENLPVKSDYTIMDNADEQQIISSDDDLRKALAYDLRGTKQITYIGLKYLVLKMSQSEQALEILKSEVTLDKDDLENKQMWYWRSIVRVKNSNTGLETEGISEAPYFEQNKYDKFARTKAISKAERNAWRKQIPELEIITLLKNAHGERTQKLQTENTTSSDAPTQKQLDYLQSLGYTGLKPATKEIASNIIEDLKNDAKEAECIDGDYEKNCTCQNPIPNAVTDGKTCQTCLKLIGDKS